MFIELVKKYFSRHIFGLTDLRHQTSTPATFIMNNHYDLESLQQQAKQNKSNMIPPEINQNDYPQPEVGIVYDVIPATREVGSSNTSRHTGNVVPMPELMDPETEKLLQRFMQQERTQPFVSEHNQLLKFYLREVKDIRDDLKKCRDRVNILIQHDCMALVEFNEVKERFIEHRKVLKELNKHFQADKTRLQAKREIYKPIVDLAVKYHPRRARNLSEDIIVFIEKQMILLDKLTQCYDKLMIATSGFLSRIEVQIQAIREILMPRRDQDVDDLLESSILNHGLPADQIDPEWNLIELRKYVAQETV